MPVSAASYGFLALVDWLQEAVFTDLPKTLGFDAAPVWWPLPLLGAWQHICGTIQMVHTERCVQIPGRCDEP